MGKRVFVKQGGKNIPRLGRRSGPMTAEELKFYNHVQPFDSKFILDFLSDELFIGEGDLKFLSWQDLDLALESDPALKAKLANIARDKEVEELRKYANAMSKDDNSNEVVSRYGDTSSKMYQKFIPYEGQNNFKYNNMENDIYYYYTNEVKRNSKADKVDQLNKIFAN